MAAELRWVLLAICLPALAAIWWWSARRAGHAPGDSALREPTLDKSPPSAPATIRADPMPAPGGADVETDGFEDGDIEIEVDIETAPRPQPKSREWGVPPFEPLNIHTGDFEHVPVLDGPMMVHAPDLADTLPATGPGTADASMTAGPAIEAVAPPAPELQRIVTIRVCSVGEGRWTGDRLLAALELHGLGFGRYQVFHRKHADGRSLFCAASLVEPGTFDLAEMTRQEFRGITLFAVLPGPLEPLATVDELCETARGLAEELSGMVQDAKGMPFSPQRAAAMREDVARFQAKLPRH